MVLNITSAVIKNIFFPQCYHILELSIPSHSVMDCNLILKFGCPFVNPMIRLVIY